MKNKIVERTVELTKEQFAKVEQLLDDKAALHEKIKARKFSEIKEKFVKPL